MRNRVVITSIGAITASGCGIARLWSSVRNGKSMIRRLKGIGFERYIGAQIEDTIVGSYNGMDRTTALGLIAADEAVREMLPSESECRNVNVFVGSSKGGLRSLLSACDARKHKALPDFLMESLHMAPADAIARRFGFGGLRMAYASSCATGIHSIIMGAKFIAEGRGKTVLAGATEASITPLMLAGYDSMGALSKNSTTPEYAMKPFDYRHDGFAIGEGAGLLLLESLDSAHRRGADILAEITGWSYGCDTYGLTANNPDGSAIIEQLKQALEMAECLPADIDYINAHGTATVQNDIAEARAIKGLFGAHAKNLHISSTKPVTGHLLGAAGSIEAIITALAMRHATVPPTINFDRSEPDFSGLNFTPNRYVEKRIDRAMTMNFAFGGHIGILVLAKCH